MAKERAEGYIPVGKRLGNIENRLERMENRIGKLDSKINYIFGAFATISIVLTALDILRH